MSFYGKIVKDTQLIVTQIADWLQNSSSSQDNKKNHLLFLKDGSNTYAIQSIDVPYDRISNIDLLYDPEESEGNRAAKIVYTKKYLDENGEEVERTEDPKTIIITENNLEDDIRNKLYWQFKSNYNENDKELTLFLQSGKDSSDEADAEGVEF